MQLIFFSFCILRSISQYTILSFISLFRYYNAIPDLKQSIMTKLLQAFLISIGIILIVGCLKNLYHISYLSSSIQILAQSYPNLTCSILSYEPWYVLSSYFLFAIISFKSMIAVYPTDFINMNHDKVWKVTIIFILSCWAFEYVFFILYFKTVCNKLNIESLGQKFEIEMDLFQYKPAVIQYHMLSLWIPQILKLMVSYSKCERKISTNQVAPIASRNVKQPDILVTDKYIVASTIIIILVIISLVVIGKMKIPIFLIDGLLIMYVFPPYWIYKHEDIYNFIVRRIKTHDMLFN